jgi:hypothetical protein
MEMEAQMEPQMAYVIDMGSPVTQSQETNEDEEEDEDGNQWTDEELMERLCTGRWCSMCGHDGYEGAQCRCEFDDVNMYCTRCGFTDKSCICARFANIFQDFPKTSSGV